VDWMYRNRVVNAVMHLRVPHNAGNFLTECPLVSQERLCSMEFVC